jgi:hypothetical protein
MSDEIIENLWAIPGLTTYLLNVDITSGQIKQLKIEDPEYSPSSIHMLRTNEFHPEYQLNSEFCNVIGNILVGSSCKKVDNNFMEVVLRQTPLAFAACRKVMALMQDPCMLVSMPTYGGNHLQVRNFAFPISC